MSNEERINMVLLCGMLALMCLMAIAMYIQRVNLDNQIDDLVIERNGQQYVLIPYPYLKGQYVSVQKDDTGRAVKAVITNDTQAK